jgi:adenylate kinase
MTSLQTFIFMGRSGCGKGTQGKLLEEKLRALDPEHDILYLESGDIFRTFIKGNNYSQKLSREVYESGALQPEFLAVWAWASLMVENMGGKEHLILDGMPRKLREAHVLDSALNFYNRGRVHIVYINVSREWSKDRLLARGRLDDNHDDVEVRLNWFDHDVLPAVNYFKDHGEYNFHDINGEQSIDKVHAEVLKKLDLH